MGKILKLIMILALIAVLILAGLMLMVSWKEHHVPQTEDYDAIVVLGAQVK